MVGGTVLQNNGGGNYSETAWGTVWKRNLRRCSNPAYQYSANLWANGSGASKINRNVVDVATEADKNVSCVMTAPQPDANLCLPLDGGAVLPKQNEVFGGTSLSSPLWAGFMALT